VAERLFFALWPERKVRDKLARLARSLNNGNGRIHNPHDLHITLVFLGQVEASRLPCVHDVADNIVSSPFTLQMDGIGHWPRPRILWCGPSGQPEALQRLVKDLQQGLQDCGFEPETRRYTPHVTLQRKVRHAEAGVIDNPIEWPAKEFVLAASGGGAPDQPRYRILHRWSLRLN